MGFGTQNAMVAILGGVVVGVVLFVPIVALSYRRRGRLTVWGLLGWVAALIYFVAIWSYTLLPLPDPESIRCVGHNLDPRTLLRDLRDARASGNPLRSAAFLQLALNVFLFVPLGFFARLLFGRGIFAATALGFVVSSLVEVTQLTGVWGIYPCAYRVFDVVDLATNTGGALLGSIVALVIPRRVWMRRPAAEVLQPHPVTRWRRLLAMVSDVLAPFLTAYVFGVAWRGFLLIIGEGELPDDGLVAWGDAVANTVTVLLIVGVIGATGRSIGDHAVELRYETGMPVFPARVLRILGGAGTFFGLGLIPQAGPILAFVFAVVAGVWSLVTVKGLPGTLMNADLRDAREAASPRAVSRA